MIQGTAEDGSTPSPELYWRLATCYLGAAGGAAHTAQRDATDSVTIPIHPDKFVEDHGTAGRSPSDA